MIIEKAKFGYKPVRSRSMSLRPSMTIDIFLTDTWTPPSSAPGQQNGWLYEDTHNFLNAQVNQVSWVSRTFLSAVAPPSSICLYLTSDSSSASNC